MNIVNLKLLLLDLYIPFLLYWSACVVSLDFLFIFTVALYFKTFSKQLTMYSYFALQLQVDLSGVRVNFLLFIFSFNMFSCLSFRALYLRAHLPDVFQIYSLVDLIHTVIKKKKNYRASAQTWVSTMFEVVGNIILKELIEF